MLLLKTNDECLNSMLTSVAKSWLMEDMDMALEQCSYIYYIFKISVQPIHPLTWKRSHVDVITQDWL